MMRAMLSTEPGGPETLVQTELPRPEPEPEEVRIAVKAAGVNFPDTIIIRDLYQFKPPRPFAPGGEVAGVVDAVGQNVTSHKIGDRVVALPIHGGFVSHLCVPASGAYPMPDALPFDEGACLLFTYGTSYYGLHTCGALAEGQTVVILGAAGGIGASAVELSKAAGARVIAAVSSEEKAAFATALGADETVIYPREMDRAAQKDLANRIKALAPEGTNIVYDPVGGDYAEPALRTLGWNGRFLVVGFPAGIPKIPLNLPLLKNCAIQGVFWGAFVAREPETFRRHVDEMFALYAAGRIRPRISARFQLEKAADALTAIESRTAQGKIVLTVSP